MGQVMDCRNFKEMLDSYLGSELAVETNHAIQRHAEQCAECRQEMSARRHLREVLREVVTKTTLGAEGHARLRARLRMTEAPRLSFMRRLLPWRVSLATAAAIVFALLLGGGYGFFLLRQQSVAAAELSPALIGEAVRDHHTCAPYFLTHEGNLALRQAASPYDTAYAELDRTAESGAAGLQLRSAHMCGVPGRRFAHIVYLRDQEAISLLVTERDPRAMKRGVVPLDDGLRAGLQHTLSGDCAFGAYQTAKYIVMVVSKLPEKENEELAARLAPPVCEYLRRAEKSLPAKSTSPSGSPSGRGGW